MSCEVVLDGGKRHGNTNASLSDVGGGGTLQRPLPQPLSLPLSLPLPRVLQDNPGPGRQRPGCVRAATLPALPALSGLRRQVPRAGLALCARAPIAWCATGLGVSGLTRVSLRGGTPSSDGLVLGRDVQKTRAVQRASVPWHLESIMLRFGRQTGLVIARLAPHPVPRQNLCHTTCLSLASTRAHAYLYPCKKPAQGWQWLARGCASPSLSSYL